MYQYITTISGFDRESTIPVHIQEVPGLTPKVCSLPLHQIPPFSQILSTIKGCQVFFCLALNPGNDPNYFRQV